MTKKNKILGFMEIALIVVGLAIIILGVINIPYIKYEMKGWKKTTAIVTDKVYVKTGQGTVEQVYNYEYYVNGHKYSNVCKMPGDGPGTEIKIYVNPNFPFKSVEAKDGLSFPIFMLIWGSVLIAFTIKFIVIKINDKNILSKGYRLPCVVDSVRLHKTTKGRRSNVKAVAKLAMDAVSPTEHFDGGFESVVICIDPNTGKGYMSKPVPGTVDHIKQGMNIYVYVDRKNPNKYVVDVPATSASVEK